MPTSGAMQLLNLKLIRQKKREKCIFEPFDMKFFMKSGGMFVRQELSDFILSMVTQILIVRMRKKKGIECLCLEKAILFVSNIANNEEGLGIIQSVKYLDKSKNTRKELRKVRKP